MFLRKLGLWCTCGATHCLINFKGVSSKPNMDSTLAETWGGTASGDGVERHATNAQALWLTMPASI